mmetsp:Transcript_64805/g.76729  ORF Transcript_64805/g.76729 Transcript_64805/m.76729 type:complete len:98 (-) Transcript_64805:1857-2150(-)
MIENHPAAEVHQGVNQGDCDIGIVSVSSWNVLKKYKKEIVKGVTKEIFSPKTKQLSGIMMLLWIAEKWKIMWALEVLGIYMLTLLVSIVQIQHQMIL